MKSAMVLAVEPDVKPLGLEGDFEKNTRFIFDLGFKGAELAVMDLDRIDTTRIRGIVQVYGLEIPAVGTGRYFLKHGLSLSSNDKGVREKAVSAVIRSLGPVAALESHFVIGVAQGKNETDPSEGLKILIVIVQMVLIV